MEGTNDDEKKTPYRRQRGFLGMPTVKCGLRLRPRPSRHKDCGPQPARLGWGPQSKTTCLSFHRNGYRFGELKRQVTLGRERGYVLFILCIRFALRLSTVFRIVLGLVFRGLSHRVGFQLVGFSAEFDRSESYLQFFLLDGNDAADHFRALGNHGLSLYRDGRGEARGKGITNVVLVAGEGLAYRRADGCAFRQVKLQNLRTVDIPCLYKSYKIQRTHLRCVPFPAPAYRPVEEQLTLRLDADVRFGKRLCPSADKLGFTFWME